MRSSSSAYTDAWQEACQLIRFLGEHGVCLRLFGSVAVWGIAAKLQPWLASARRGPGDIDAVSLRETRPRLRALMRDAGYDLDDQLALATEGHFYVFTKSDRLPLEVHFDDLQFCHTIPLADRLSEDHLKLPLADLLLTKLEIVELTEPDACDLIVLLCVAHEAMETPLISRWGVEEERLTSLLGRDWGAWYTVMRSLDSIDNWLQKVGTNLEATFRTHATATRDHLTDILRRCPKSLTWRLRAIVGPRLRWYQTVSEQRRVF